MLVPGYQFHKGATAESTPSYSKGLESLRHFGQIRRSCRPTVVRSLAHAITFPLMMTAVGDLGPRAKKKKNRPVLQSMLLLGKSQTRGPGDPTLSG